MMARGPPASTCSRLGRSQEGWLDPQSQDYLLPVRSPGPSAVIMIKGKAQRRAELIFIESGEGKLCEKPHIGATLRRESQGPLSANQPHSDMVLTPNGCPVWDCLLAPFPQANARLVRTLIYISLGGVRPGVKEQSCSIPESRVFRAGLSHNSPATTSVDLAPLPKSEPRLQCQVQHRALCPCFCPF